ncbi:MAG: PD-(D/E)XK nuclease family protein [Prolixibacteraceae bacterium]
MSKFLKNVAEYLFSQHANGMEHLNVVFPNRRAGLFFQKYLSQLIQQPLFSPNVLTISDLVGQFSSLKVVDHNVLIVELYQVFVELTQSGESLDDFYYWGEMLLSDFEDVDKYLVDTKQLFSNIQSLKEIDYGLDFLDEEQIQYLSTFWSNILQARQSGFKDEFLNIWRKLLLIYKKFNLQLEQKGWAYEGMMYRKMAEHISSLDEFDQEAGYVLVGFNALNKCEENLFSFLQTKANASFFWDYDDYYKEAQQHEAALFLHKNMLKFPMPDDFDVSSQNFSQLKEIEVVAVPGFAGQANFAASWLDLNKEQVTNQFDNTALVLCDETLLIPMLNSIPDSVSDLNITMGFPVKSSPAYALLKGLIDVDRNSRFNKNGELVFYFRNVLALMSNPLMKEFIGHAGDQFVEQIRTENKIYLTGTDFEQVDFLNIVFALPTTAQQCKEYLHTILKTFFATNTTTDHILKESLYQLYLSINRLHDSLFADGTNIGKLFSKKLYYQLLLRQLDRLTIPFEGEPLLGVQLMGFLETRCLDFDNLILLSFNDDKLPGNSHRHSFVPYSLRKGFGLPVIEQRNAMYAYYFYRLIQRAKKVTMVYDSRTDGLSGGEVSRFATQLKFEAKHLVLNEKQGIFNFEPGAVQNILVEKTEPVVLKIKNFVLNKRISPSALNRYLECKLSFFFKYIEGINETDEVREDIDHLIFGRVAHKALELLLLPFVGKEMDAADFNSILKDKKKLSLALNHALQTEYFKKGNFELNGRNLLVYDIILKYIVRILKYDKTIAPLKILSLEKTYEHSINLDVFGERANVRYGGVVDRLDQTANKIRVVDYKTGASENQLSSLDKLFESEKQQNKAAFQTMLYANCVVNQLDVTLPVVPSVYGARSVFMEDFNPSFQLSGGQLIYQANAVEFESRLQLLLEELVDVDVPFTQTAKVATCKFCDYKGICKR